MKNKINSKSATAAVIALGMVSAPLTSCTMDDTTATQVQGSALGAIGGAIVGGAIGLATGGNTESVIAGAIAGGIAGGIAGLVWANSIVKEKAAYANMEDYVNDNIAQLDKRTEEAKKTNAELSKKVADLKAETKSLDAESKKQIATNLSLIDTDITTAKDAITEASGAKKAELEQQVKALESERDALADLCSI